MDINRYLDHAVLKPEMSEQEARDAIKLGVRFNVKTVCVRPSDIKPAQMLCAGTDTAIITVLDFPHGCATTEVKRLAVRQYVADGVAELDMVANYGLIRSHRYQEVQQDIAAVVGEAKPFGVGVKVILETDVLDEDEIHEATLAAVRAGANFVKTSTGFYGSGATERAVQIMLAAGAGRIKVKPSGGVRSYEDAVRFLKMGAQRLGVGYGSTEAICMRTGTRGDGY